jgi:hypothetical protein
VIKVEPADDQLVYDRTLRTQVRVDGEWLEITATVVDDTFSFGGFQRVHDMGLVMRVRRSDRQIISLESTMDAHPHPQCPQVEATMQRLVGLRIARGYVRAVNEKIGATRGCNHLATLALQAGTVAALSFAGEMISDEPGFADLDYDDFFGTVRDRHPAVEGSCQVWAPGGVLVQRLERRRS